jgi:hypothetical protein
MAAQFFWFFALTVRCHVSTFLATNMPHFFPAAPLLSIFCKAETADTGQGRSLQTKKPRATGARG